MATQIDAEQARQVGVGVERSLGLQTGDAGNVVEHAVHGPTAPVEDRSHHLDRAEVTLDGGECRALGDVAHVRREVRLQVRRGPDDVGRTDQPADTPAGHRIGLGDTVEDHAGVGQLGDDLQDAVVHRIAVDEVLVDLVGHDDDAVLQRPPTDRLDLGAGVDGSGRIGWRHEDEDLGAVGACRLELLDGDAETGRLVGREDDRDTAGQGDRLGIGRPERCGQEDLVALVDQHREGRVDRVFATVGDDHLLGGDGDAGVAQCLGGDSASQLRQAGRRRVPVVLRVVTRSGRRLDDVVGGREVGLSGAEADDRLSRRLQRLGLAVHRESGGGRDRGDATGDAGCRHGGEPTG